MSRRTKVLPSSEVRVLIAEHAKEIRVDGVELNIRDAEGRRLLWPRSAVILKPAGSKIKINGQTARSGRVDIASQDGVVCINGVSYHGRALILADPGGLSVVNQLPLEEYLSSVVGSEMDRRSPIEALKAQAVAARTYTVFHLVEGRGKVFDISTPERSQQYKGKRAKTARTIGAVHQTRGIILELEGEVFPAFYHSRCGGSTIRAGDLWPAVRRSPKGVVCRPCLREKKSPWTLRLNLAEFRKLLMNAGQDVPDVFSVEIVRAQRTKRVQVVRIAGRPLSAHQLRMILGPSRMKSTLFWAKLEQNFIVFEGAAWGHGAGMCQYGAVSLAGKGLSYARILKYYYPKTKLVKVRYEL